MKHARIWDALKDHFYMKDYDGKIGKSANSLADETLGAIQHLLDNPVVPEVSKPEEYATINGVKYKLEEIKK